jgi:hypothetical protein
VRRAGLPELPVEPAGGEGVAADRGHHGLQPLRVGEPVEAEPLDMLRRDRPSAFSNAELAKMHSPSGVTTATSVARRSRAA